MKINLKNIEKKAKEKALQSAKLYANIANPDKKDYLNTAVSGAIVGSVVGGTHGLNFRDPAQSSWEDVGMHALAGGALGAGVSTLRKYLFSKGMVI